MLAEKCRTMKTSGIREIFELANTIEDAVHLEIGEPNFETPRNILEAGEEALRKGYTKYSSAPGMPELRKVLAEKIRKKNGYQADWQDITVTTGAVFACSMVMHTLLNPGDTVLIPSIHWTNYELIMGALQALPSYFVMSPEYSDFLDMGSLEKALTPKAKLLVINSPNNPTGMVFGEKTLRKLLDFARENNLYILSDEVYEDLIYERRHISPAALDTGNRVFSVYSFSKSYAMTGWRIGYVHSPADMTPHLQKFIEAFVSCPSSISQKAAEEAVTGPQNAVESMRNEYKKRRDAAIDILNANGVRYYKPEGAFYIFCDISQSGMDSYTFAKELLKAEHVAVAPGLAFGRGGEGYIRIAYTVQTELVGKGVKAFCRFLTRER
jgi:aspartate aminotransferase/aminotransferase